ncbi:MAG: c-type cytochrome [Tatlockia sp.]|jgi:cytochrome c553
MKKILLALLLLGQSILSYSNVLKTKALCAACHGEQGLSKNPLVPHLAGQQLAYLLKQLQDFKRGTTRTTALKTAVLSPLSAQDLSELADFYSQKPLPQASVTEKFSKRGELLYRGGDYKKRIMACIVCHGPKGYGNAEAGFPVLTGQRAAYTLSQLQAFKEKKRRNDLNAIMQTISAGMSQDDMEAVALYIQSLH